MKKKGISKRKKSDKEKIREEIRKLKVKIPEQKKETKSEEDSELEEDIKETEEIIEDTEFHEFFQPREGSFSSLLQIIETPQETLEENIAATPVEKDENQNVMSYSPDADYSQGKSQKYQDASVVLRRVETSQELPRQDLMNPFESQRTNVRNAWNEKIEARAIEEKRTLPFEKEERKYKQVREE